MPVQKIGDVIATSGNLGSLARHAQRLRDLQHLLLDALPPAFATACRVTNLKSGTLVILADNPAVAAKLRQLAPRLATHMQKQGIEVTVIRVDVQVKTHKIKGEDEVTKPPLAPDAIRKIEDLSEGMPPSPLRAALVRMAARHRGRKRR